MPTLVIPCPNNFPCAGTDSPFANITAEAPDEPVYWAPAYRRSPMPLGASYGSFGAYRIDVCPDMNCTQDEINETARQNADLLDQNPIFADPPLISPPDTEAENRDSTPIGDVQLPVQADYPRRQRPPRYRIPPPPPTPPFEPPPPTPTRTVTTYRNQASQRTSICSNGSVFVVPIPANKYLSTRSQSAANSMALAAALNFIASNKSCISTLDLIKVCSNEAYSDFFASSPMIATLWEIVGGSLPPGLSMNGDGEINGTPTTGGSFEFDVRANFAGGSYAVKHNLIQVFQIVTGSSLPGGTPGSPYSTTITTLGGTPPIVWSLTSGALPPGLSLDPGTGTISGTPPLTIGGNPNPGGTFDFELQATDTGQGPLLPALACTKDFQIVIAPAPVPAPTPSKWWKLEESLTFNRVDQVDGSLFDFFAETAPGFISNTGGRVGNGLLFNVVDPTGNATVAMATNSTPGVFNKDIGWTMTFWVRWSAIEANNWLRFPSMYTGPSGWFQGMILYNGVLSAGIGADLQYSLPTDAVVSQAFNPVLGDWYFFRLVYNGATGKMGVSINDGPLNYSATTYFFAAAITVTSIMFACNPYFGGFAAADVVTIDEFGIFWNKILTDDETAYLYNSGAGRTYPYV